MKENVEKDRGTRQVGLRQENVIKKLFRGTKTVITREKSPRRKRGTERERRKPKKLQVTVRDN